MNEGSRATVTRLLRQWQAGDQNAVDRLFPLIYEELHGRARGQRRRWQGDYTLNTTALVHEAYLRLVEPANQVWQSRAHFLAVAARAMRQILINYAARRRTRKRGGDYVKVSLQTMPSALGEAVGLTGERAEQLVLLDRLLHRLETVDARAARVVECRFFGGMTIAETAEVLGISSSTANRDWAMAQAWLFARLHEEDA